MNKEIFLKILKSKDIVESLLHEYSKELNKEKEYLKLRPYLNDINRFKPHYLKEAYERAIKHFLIKFNILVIRYNNLIYYK